jgi:hypothetical protein
LKYFEEEEVVDDDVQFESEQDIVWFINILDHLVQVKHLN